jgi:hypothetical protein
MDLYKDPRILLCGHSFCEECLKKLIINYKLSCPTCRKVHKSIQLEDYPKNYALIEMVENHKKAEQENLKKRSKTSKSFNKKPKKSNPERNKTFTGISIVTEKLSKIDPNIYINVNDKALEIVIPRQDYASKILPWFNVWKYYNQLLFTYCFVALSIVKLNSLCLRLSSGKSL